MSQVWSCNEWDPLEEVIVGNPLGARFPYADPSTRLAEYPDRELADIPQGAFPDQIIEETDEDLQGFVDALEARGVTVRRPDTWPHEQTISTVQWETRGYYNYCPRDVLLVIGDTIIETPNVIRGRSLETGSYRRLLMEYYDSGAKWFSAPKPLLEDRLFEFDPAAPTPQHFEPAFDAANILRFGRDLLYLVSATGNELGGHWLQRILGDEFCVHFMKDVYFGSHIDSTLVALRPGLVLANPERLSMDTDFHETAGLMEMKNNMAKWLWYNADVVVRDAIKGVEAGKPVVVSGRLYRWLDPIFQSVWTRRLLRIKARPEETGGNRGKHLN